MTKPIDLDERRKRLIMSEPDDGLSAGPELQDWVRSPVGQTPADPVFAWVIEKGSAPRYYAPTEPGEWTTDHLKACRFARKEDAEAIQFRHVTHGLLPEQNTSVCEHGWG